MAASRAWVFSARGDPSQVLSLTTRPAPTLPPALPLPRDVPDPEEWILVRVAFAALNVGALFQMALVPAWLRRGTCVPEMDLSGTVVDAWHPGNGDGDGDGDDARAAAAAAAAAAGPRFRRGDRVVAMLPAGHALATGTGALAEVVAVPARYAVAKPAAVSLADGAGCLLAGMTAAQMVDESGAGPGHRVLVNAASGGVGTMAVQMVRRAVGEGGYVVGVCSGKNAELVRGLGADEVVDYTLHADLAAHLAALFAHAPFDAVIDTLGIQSLYLASPRYLSPAGVYSSAGIQPPSLSLPHVLAAVWQMKRNEWWPTSRWLLGAGRRWRGVSMMAPTLADRERVVGMLGRGEVRVVRDGVWAFEDAVAAYGKLAGRHARGKVLVKVDASVGDDEC